MFTANYYSDYMETFTFYYFTKHEVMHWKQHYIILHES